MKKQQFVALISQMWLLYKMLINNVVFEEKNTTKTKRYHIKLDNFNPPFYNVLK